MEDFHLFNSFSNSVFSKVEKEYGDFCEELYDNDSRTTDERGVFTAQEILDEINKLNK